jgi:hypothetical protein
VRKCNVSVAFVTLPFGLTLWFMFRVVTMVPIYWGCHGSQLLGLPWYHFCAHHTIQSNLVETNVGAPTKFQQTKQGYETSLCLAEICLKSVVLEEVLLY